MHDFDIRYVDFDYNKKANAFHFYPNRKFDAETTVFLYRKESFGNGQYLNYFYDCDKKNIKVNLFCANNFFPLASLVSHSCYTEAYKDLNYLLPNSHLSRYGCDVTQFTESNDCKEIRNCENKLINNYKIESLNKAEELYDFFKDRPVYMSEQFLEHFNAIKDEFDSEKICAEWKCIASPRAMNFLRSFESDKIINIDKQFSWRAAERYNLGQTYLSFQFLMSAYKSWRYIALGGASNVMQLFYPINTLFFGDNHCDGDCPNTALLKIKLNKYLYGEEPISLRTETKRCMESKKHINYNDLSDEQMSAVKRKILCHL